LARNSLQDCQSGIGTGKQQCMTIKRMLQQGTIILQTITPTHQCCQNRKYCYYGDNASAVVKTPTIYQKHQAHYSGDQQKTNSSDKLAYSVIHFTCQKFVLFHHYKLQMFMIINKYYAGQSLSTPLPVNRRIKTKKYTQLLQYFHDMTLLHN
jgi:hypothetical protein